MIRDARTDETNQRPQIMLEFYRAGQLAKQGYNKAPAGRPCRLCNEVGGVWLKAARHGRVEVAYCSNCDGVHTVQVM